MRFIGRLKYAFYVIFHPFKGFWELKNEKRGSLGAGLTIFFVCMFSNILRGQFTGYLFNKYYRKRRRFFDYYTVRHHVFSLVYCKLVPHNAYERRGNGKGNSYRRRLLPASAYFCEYSRNASE